MRFIKLYDSIATPSPRKRFTCPNAWRTFPIASAVLPSARGSIEAGWLESVVSFWDRERNACSRDSVVTSKAEESSLFFKITLTVGKSPESDKYVP